MRRGVAGTVQLTGGRMDYDESLDTAVERARSALKLMEKSRIPPTPKNFELFYSYAGNRIPDLQWMMKRMLEAGQITEAACTLLHERFIDGALKEEQRKVSDTLEQAAKHIESANEGAAKYGQALEDFSGRLGTVAGQKDLAPTLEFIFAETRAMAAVNRELEGRLQSSVNEIAQLRQNLAETRKEAATDPLTGIANRKVFDEGLRSATADARRDTAWLSLLVIDIDHFKAFNDRYGHQLGDQVLKLVAKCVTECIRKEDLAARFGGEEFCVILPGVRLADGVKIAESIRRRVASRKITNRRTGEVLGNITLSIGVAEYTLGESEADFLRHADEAMYAAKRTGRNKVATQEDVARAPA